SVLDVDLQVVLQVFPHGGNIDDSVDAEFLEFVRGTDARQLQQLRGVECTSAADDGAAVFAAIVVLHSDCAYPLDQDPVYQRARSDREVLPAQHRVEVGARGAVAAPMADVPVERPETLLAIAVDVGGERVAGLLRGLEERGEQRVAGGPAFEDKRPVV